MARYLTLLEFGSLEILLERTIEDASDALDLFEIQVFSEGKLSGEVDLASIEVEWLRQGLAAADAWGRAGFPEQAGNGASWRGGEAGEWGPDLRRRWVVHLLGERRVHVDFEDARVLVRLRSLANPDEWGLRQVAVVLDLDHEEFQTLVRTLGTAGYPGEPVGWHKAPQSGEE